MGGSHTPRFPEQTTALRSQEGEARQEKADPAKRKAIAQELARTSRQQVEKAEGLQGHVGLSQDSPPRERLAERTRILSPAPASGWVCFPGMQRALTLL